MFLCCRLCAVGNIENAYVTIPALKELTRQLGIDTKKMIENHKDGTASRPKFQTIV